VQTTYTCLRSRPSTSWMEIAKKDVDARDTPGHDEGI
jgi:hypothetical protein